MTPRQYYVRTDDNGGEFFFLPPQRPGSVVATVPPSPLPLEPPVAKGLDSNVSAPPATFSASCAKAASKMSISAEPE